MSTFKARGIVLKTIDTKESDKFVTLLLKEKGKFKVSAKGARNKTSKFLTGTQLFTYSDFIIYEGNRFYTLSQVDVIESFFSLREDYKKFCYATFFLEICEKTIMENMESDEILKLLLKSLKLMSLGTKTEDFIFCVFIFKFLQLSGYAPELRNCVSCGRTSNIYFFGRKGANCEFCAKDDMIKLSKSSIMAIDYILSSDIKGVFNFKISEDILEILKSSAKIFLENNLDVYLKTKDFL